MRSYYFTYLIRTKELKFDFDNKPKRFIDVETGEFINLYPEYDKGKLRNGRFGLL
jgi:hypothetical protein